MTDMTDIKKIETFTIAIMTFFLGLVIGIVLGKITWGM
jgi:hypothetical protein